MAEGALGRHAARPAARPQGAWRGAFGGPTIDSIMTTPVTNIQDSGVDERMRQAVGGLGVTLATLVAFAAFHAPIWLVATLFVPFFGVSLLAMQSLYGTCVFMGAKGMRDLGDGAEKVVCPVMSCGLRAQARRIWLASFGGAAAMTGLAVAAVAIR